MGAQWKAKHKEEAANAKGKMFTKLTKEIMIAARSGADPDMNPRLRLAIVQAKKASMTRETLERAIKKGSGQLDGAVSYEKVTYEGYAPHQVPVIVECLTDNVNRTISNIRGLFRKGQLGTSGSVSWDFDHLGIIEATANNADADVETAAIEAGAQDFELDDEGTATFYTEPTDLDLVQKALPDQGFTVVSAKIGYKPKNPVSLSGEALEEVEAFLAAIDNDDDVHEVYVGLAG
ncbi:MAG TPA: YebC/PmpR family DNA-binding transcriptional regulator [Cellvibrio sp.]|nr:YebC/PmpR family DNA-binding transcriptional regulator [Cellvibrio sp.]